MKIALVSDLHLEFEPIKNKSFFKNAKNADILIVAGDTAEIKNYARYSDFFLQLEDLFKDVRIIAGNHEGYSSSIERVEEVYSSLNDFHHNIVFENKQVFVRDNILFVGTTLWTNFNNCNPIAMQSISWMMNDFRLIDYKGHTLTPEDVLGFFNDEYQFIRTIVEHSSHYDKIVVFTHHAPSFKSVGKNYISDESNPGYASELSEFILDNPKIKLWVHGHIHDPCDYMIGETRIVSNPRGYPPDYYSQNKKFDSYKPKVIEV
jgi:Icc-related predicted phosphoesterase